MLHFTGEIVGFPGAKLALLLVAVKVSGCHQMFSFFLVVYKQVT